MLKLSKDTMDTVRAFVQTMIEAEILEEYTYTDSAKISEMTLYVQDKNEEAYERLQSIWTSRQCKERLRLELVNNGVSISEDMQCFCKQAPPPQDAKLLAEGVYLAIENQERIHRRQSLTTKVKVTVLRGNMQRKYYVLDPSKKTEYNIGRGEHPSLSNNRAHHNHIVFTDEESNRDVSRKHACILFSASRGFCLQAYEGGTHSHGNRTRILRRNEEIELVSPLVDYTLQDGDQVEIGRNAVLRLEFVASPFSMGTNNTLPTFA